MTLDERLCDQIAHAYAHAPAIRKIMDGAGVRPTDIRGAADLPKIPVTSKDKLVQMHHDDPPFGGFLAVDPATLARIYISPGPIYDPQPYDEGMVQAALAALSAGNFGKGDRVLNTFMYHLTPAGLGVDDLLRRLGCTVIPSGPGNTELQIKMMMDLRTVGYVGTPSFLAIILDKADEMKVPKQAIPIKKALFGAEPYTPSQRARFEGEYGMHTANVYATADLGYIGFSVPGMTGFCIVESHYVEIADPQTGQLVEPGATGEIVVTTFNRGYPLVRFGTGDLGSLATELDALCEGRQQLMGLFGRSGDAIKVRGMFLHPNQLGAAVAQVPTIKHAQAIITRVDNHDVVTIRIELHPGHGPSDIETRLKALVQTAARLRVDAVEVVPPGVIDPAQRMVSDERSWD